MDFKLFWLICLSISVCPFGHSAQGVTTNSPINGLKSSSSLPLTIETNSSIIYELSPKATEPEESIDPSSEHSNQTRKGQLIGSEMLTGQEQNQNQYFQGRGPPNRFPPQFYDKNYGSQPDMNQGLPRQRQPNFGNQMKSNQRNLPQQLNPYDFLNSIDPPSGQNGFHTGTPIKQQQPVNGFPIGANYPSGLNPNQVHGNVGVNQGFGLPGKPSDGYNDQSGETESPEQLGDQSDGINEETDDEGAENVGGEGEDDGGNEEVTPNEEGANDEANGNDEIVDNNEGGDGEDEAQEGADGGGGASEGGEQTDFDDARAASTDSKGGEATVNSAEDDESTDADGSTAGGGQEGEQDPNNDPDLNQFQNFQGGNFPGDLFPPGILSQQDLQEIQKSMEEQQRKEAEKQKAEEEAAAGQNEGGEDGGEENGEGNETSEGGGEEETDSPAATPPAANPYIPVTGYGRQINNQPNLLDINRVLAGRAQNPGLIDHRQFNSAVAGQRGSPRDRNRYDGGFSNRGDFGTGIQDYEYEKPKVNREEDEIPNRLRGNPIFNRNRLFPSHRQVSNDDEDEENDQDERRRHPPYMRNRFANRFDRFRPRLFGRPGRYNEDLGDYGVHRANSNQQPSIDYKSNPFTIDNGFNPSYDNQGNTIKQSLTQGDKQSLITYEND